MSSPVCAPDGSVPEGREEWAAILSQLSTDQLALGIFLVAGGVISVLPQLLRMYRRKSSTGVSYMFLLFTLMNQFCSLSNAVILKFRQLQACDHVGIGECAPSLIPIFQIGGMMATCFPLYLLYLRYYGSKETEERRAEFRHAFRLLCLFGCFVLVVIAVTASFIAAYGVCGSPTRMLGYLMGLAAVGFTVVQLAPQIYKTFRSKMVGSFSITMLLLQAPGTLLLVYYFAVVSEENITTWIAFLFTAIQQFILLFLLLNYRNNSLPHEEVPYTHLPEEGEGSAGGAPSKADGKDGKGGAAVATEETPLTSSD